MLKDGDGVILAKESTLFTAPKFLRLQKRPIICRLKRETQKTLTLRVQSSTYHHKVWLYGFEGFRASDNFFDLPAGETVRVTLDAIGQMRSRGAPEQTPSAYSLIDSSL